MFFWRLPKVILGGVCAMNNHIERCIYVAKSYVFLSETENKNLHFFDFVQVECAKFIFISHIKTHGQIKTTCFFW